MALFAHFNGYEPGVQQLLRPLRCSIGYCPCKLPDLQTWNRVVTYRITRSQVHHLYKDFGGSVNAAAGLWLLSGCLSVYSNGYGAIFSFQRLQSYTPNAYSKGYEPDVHESAMCTCSAQRFKRFANFILLGSSLDMPDFLLIRSQSYHARLSKQS